MKGYKMNGDLSLLCQAEEGNSDAQFKLGALYEMGKGVGKNLKKAAYWYQKATEQNNPHGQYLLALLYERGEGVKKSFKKAAYWYQKAADQGINEAQCELGKLFLLGRGCKQDIISAKKWLTLSISSGNKNAKIWMDTLLEITEEQSTKPGSRIQILVLDSKKK
jgi:TPR repeat protein